MPANMRAFANGMFLKGYNYLIFIEDRAACKTDFFCVKWSNQAGRVLREDFPTYRVSSVWDLKKVFAGKGAEAV